ncbi:MAG: MFS transporter, partial [Acidobacteria bacterium]|nr:MFS transporter [Acidobacteriota bacterium]
GLITAPPLAAYMAPLYGWRSAFLAAGALGFVWIPLWWFAARRAPVQAAAVAAPRAPIGDLLRSVPFWGIVAATVLAMTVYSLWTNFTTIYFVKALGMDHVRANRSVAWIPALLGGFGGLAGGAVSLRMIRAGMKASDARRRAALLGAVLIALTTGLVPMSNSPIGAALLISVSYFCASAVSVNLYALPIDIFGPGRAAFNVAALTCAFGLMNFFFLPWVGRIIDKQGFGPVCSITAGVPLLGIGLLHLTKER